MSDMVYIPNINVQKEGIDVLNNTQEKITDSQYWIF